MGLIVSKPSPAADRALPEAHEPHGTVKNADGSLTKWGTRFEDPELKEIVLRTDANVATLQVAEAVMEDVQGEGVGADVELVVQGVAIKPLKAPKAATKVKKAGATKAPASAKKAPASKKKAPASSAKKKVQQPKKLPAQKVGLKRVASAKKKGAAQRRPKAGSAMAAV